MQTTEKLFNLFIETKLLEGRSLKTIEWYQHMIKPFLEYKGTATLEISEVTAPHIRTYLASERTKDQSSRTLRSRYDVIETFLNWLELEAHDYNHPSPMWKGRKRIISRPKLIKIKQPILSIEEFKAITEAIEPNNWADMRDKAILYMLFNTGIRRGELLQMKFSDIHFGQKEVTIKRGKTYEEQEIPICNATKLNLFGYLLTLPRAPEKQIWYSATRKQNIKHVLSETGLRYILKKRFNDANLEYKSTHSFRRGFATHLLNNDADISFIQHMLGHTTPAMTLTYYAFWQQEKIKEKYSEYFQ